MGWGAPWVQKKLACVCSLLKPVHTHMQINPQRLVRGESKYLKASQVPDRRSAHFNISGKDVSFKENITTVILFFVTQKKPSVT